MPMTVACPGCGMQLAVPSKCVGQILSCPSCHCQFQVSAPPDGSAPSLPSLPPHSMTPTAPPAGTLQPHGAPLSHGTPGPTPVVSHSSGRLRTRGPVWSDSTDEPPPAKGRDGANGVPAVASPPVAVPRFIAGGSAPSAMLLAADGKLPELSLIEVQERGKSATADAKKSRPKLLSVAIGLSMVMSVFLGMYDLSPVEPGADAKSVSRATIRRFYLRPDEEESLQPYQLLLRDAERAHSRGDDAIAAAKYRQVLRMLRIEGRPEGRLPSLSDTKQSDQELEHAISTVLRND
jgi:hypothetical protein